jgi:hypothetical protein
VLQKIKCDFNKYQIVRLIMTNTIPSAEMPSPKTAIRELRFKMNVSTVIDLIQGFFEKVIAEPMSYRYGVKEDLRSGLTGIILAFQGQN